MAKKTLNLSRFRLTIFIIFALFALIVGVFLALPVSRKDFTRVEIGRNTVMAEVASTPRARALGLSGRDKIADLSGMLFMFDHEDYHSIWMKDMNFSIDILWIRGGRVVDIEEEVLPPSAGMSDVMLPVYRPDVPARFVLELKGGFAKKHDVRIGDEVKIVFKDLSQQVFASESPGSTASNLKISEGVDMSSHDGTAQELGEKYFIETLRNHPPRGNGFRVGPKILENDAYVKFPVLYKSGELEISGTMNVPSGDPPEGGFPVLILAHGLIPKEIYFSGRGSKREQDFFARNGYITLHPDYRGLASSSPDTSEHHDFYVGYTEDVVALLNALKKSQPKFVDLNRIGMWGHSMGGGIAARVMVLRPDIRAYVLFASISANVEDNFYELTPEETAWLAKTYGMGGEARKIYDKISPLNYFSEVQAPVQLHHGTDDKDVPIEFSEKMFEALKSYGKKAEFFQYFGEAHEFGDGWRTAAERALQFFDKYVKGAR